MSKTYLVSLDSLKTVAQGALGAMTFGVYHQFTTNKLMDINNEKQDLSHKYFMDKMEIHHKQEMKELRDKIEKIEKRVWF